MQTVVFDSIHAYRLKGSQTYMKRDLHTLNIALLNALKDLRGKVQACSRRGHRATLARIDSLIAIAVGRTIGAIDIRWQRHMSELLNPAKKILQWLESYATFAKGSSADDLCLHFVLLTEKQPLAHSDLPSRVNQALPFVGLLGYLVREQYFNPAPKKIPCRRIVRTHRLRLGPAPMTVQTRRKDAGVVEYNQIIWPKKLWKISKAAVLDVSGTALQVQ